jgi:hypothetical protein
MKSILCLCLLLFVTGCKSGRKEFASMPEAQASDPHLWNDVRTRLTRESAVKIAEREMRKRGYKAFGKSEFESRSLRFDEASRRWIVSYQSFRLTSKETYLSVIIDDASGDAVISPIPLDSIREYWPEEHFH